MAYNSLFSKTPFLFIDQYALTMGAADYPAQMERVSTQQIFFRHLIPNGFKDSKGDNLKIPYLVVGGLGPFMEWLDNWKVTEDEAQYLASIKGPDGTRNFPDAYIDHLRNTPLKVSIDAMPEGELVFPDEPVARITGPHYQVEMLEAAFLNLVTAQTGWTTIASQFWLAAQTADRKAALYEFGARRTPEWGGLGSARSAYMAGWAGTSNMYAGLVYGIPTVGTMAHAYIMVRESELEAFRDWAKNMPHLAVFLVDTYDTLEGVKNAISVCKELKIPLRGIRLDSGDMEYLSVESRRLLDEAGYPEAFVMASDSLNIVALHQLYQVKQAPLDGFGIGGNYVGRKQDTTGVSAVMKAAEIAGRGLMKYSNAPDKSTFPGVHDVIRFMEEINGNTYFAGDTIIPFGMYVGKDRLACDEIVSIPRYNPSGLKPFPKKTPFYKPIIPIMREGNHLLPEFQQQDARAILEAARARFFESMAKLHPTHKQIVSPRLYGVGVEEGLYDDWNKRNRTNTILRQRGRQAGRFASLQLENK